MIRFLPFFLAAMVAACASSPARPKIEIVEKKVPVAVPCVKKAPVPPVYQYGVGDYPGDSEAVKLLVSDLEASKQYGLEWVAATTGCIIPPGGDR